MWVRFEAAGTIVNRDRPTTLFGAHRTYPAVVQTIVPAVRPAATNLSHKDGCESHEDAPEADLVVLLGITRV